jgi:4-diphosphocytidyl-2-C-methyl-D-erythritol kinase
MITFPNAKINLGLRVLRKRNDSFHDIETVFYPIGLNDVLEVLRTGEKKTAFRSSGISLGADQSDAKKNLVLSMYELLKKDFDLPPLYTHLHKLIPAGAGLGGGSSDCAFMLKMLNKMFNLGLNMKQQQDYASCLGSDCAFFLKNKPVLASGRGELLEPVSLDLAGSHIIIIKPKIHIITAEAYSWVKPSEAGEPLAHTIRLPLFEWKNRLVNDFEKAVFNRYPAIRTIKEKLYRAGAFYAAMSGSGSAVFGLFDHKAVVPSLPAGYFQWTGKFASGSSNK